jgi:hypothetical protein
LSITHGDLCSSNLSTLVHPRGFVWVCCSILSTLVHPRGFVFVCCSNLSTLVHPRGVLLLNLKYPGSTTVFCVAKSKVPWFTHGDLFSSNLSNPHKIPWVNQDTLDLATQNPVGESGYLRLSNKLTQNPMGEPGYLGLRNTNPRG